MLQLESKKHDLGAGFIVRRVLPQRQQRMVGPFTFLDHMGPVELKPHQNSDVRPHPHIGLSTLTYLFEGRSVHRDSLGECVTIVPGEVNLMTAGQGIVHSERQHIEDREIFHTMHGLQFWIALPDHLEDCEPHFKNYSSSQIPKDENEDRTISVVVGSAFNNTSPVYQSSPMLFLDLLSKNDFTFKNTFSDFQIGFYVVSGGLQYQSNSIGENQIIIFEPNEWDQIRVNKNSRIAVIGGEKFMNPRHIWWNFVASSKEKIEEAKLRWKEGRFPKVPGETEEIPLPEN